MKATMMQTLWALIEILAAPAGGQDAAAIARVSGIELRQASENAYVVFYESPGPLKLQDGVVVGVADVREFKTQNKPPFVVLRELQGTCVDVAAIERHLGPVSPPTPPSNPFPDALITRELTFKGQRLALGFKWSKPDCLSSVSFKG